MAWESFDEFKKRPLKSSRIPCKDPSDAVDPGDVPATDPVFQMFAKVGLVSGWKRPEDGVFPLITQASVNSIRVPAGSGYIVHPIDGLFEVAWNETILPLTMVNAQWITTVAVDASGAVVQLTGNIDPQYLRDHIILGTVTHLSGAIDGINNTPTIWGAVPYAAYDLAMAQKNMPLEGGLVYPNAGANLKLNLQKRSLFFYGGNPNSEKNPNVIQQDVQYAVQFYRVTAGSLVQPLTQLLPVGMYNPSGGNNVIEVDGPAGTSTIFRMYQLGDKLLMLYGQNKYATLAAAVAAVSTEQFILPVKLSGATLLAAIAVRADATDLTDPTQGSVINIGGPGGGSSSPGTPALGVSPIRWDWEHDGITDRMPLAGADVADGNMYDTYQEMNVGEGDFVALRPTDDFTLDVENDPAESGLILVAGAAEAGTRGFTILRGYALPYVGNTPVTTFGRNVIYVDSSVTLTASMCPHNRDNYVVSESNSDIDITLRVNGSDTPGEDWEPGASLSIVQFGEGKVRLLIESGGEIHPPEMFELETRGQYATVGLSRTYDADDVWVASGDLLRTAANAASLLYPMPDRSVDIGVNITSGNGKAGFVAPFDMQLDTIANRGVLGSLITPQPSGTLFAFDIKYGVPGGSLSSIFEVKPTIDNGEYSTVGAVSPAAYTSTFTSNNRVIPAGSYVRLDFTSVGDAGAKGFNCDLRYTRAS